MPSAQPAERPEKLQRRNHGPHVNKSTLHNRGKKYKAVAGNRPYTTCPRQNAPITARPSHPTDHSHTPSHQPNFPDKLQASALQLTSCPKCKEIFVLTSEGKETGFSVQCKLCGILPSEHQTAARTQQIEIINTALKSQHGNRQATDSMQEPKEKRKTATEGQTYIDRDEDMGGSLQPTTHTVVAHSTTQQPDTETHQDETKTECDNDEELDDYEDDDQDEDTTEKVEYEAPWFDAMLEKLDARWETRWTTLQDHLRTEAKNNRKEFQKIKAAQKHGAESIELLAKDARDRFDVLEQKQDNMILEQEKHTQALQTTRESIIKNIEQKLQARLEHMQQPSHVNARHEHHNNGTYAQKAAQAPPTMEPQDKPLPKYTSMVRKTSTRRPAATQTNGALARLYVMDWRSEPVGIVKKALRQDIAEWSQAQLEKQGQMTNEEVWPDLDAVRHLNQFGSPDRPMMEIACVPEKVDVVREFLADNNIELWPEQVNPFIDPSILATDTTEEANRKKIGHFTRLLVAWWKAANFVQSKDTSLFYQRLITQAVQSDAALHKWPSFITGISIDARGVSEAKDNPDIAFEYIEGFTAPDMNKKSKRKPKPQMRTMATGGAPPPNLASKRQRQEEQEGETADEQMQEHQGDNVEARTPSATNTPAPAHTHIPATPEQSRTGGSPVFSNTPLNHIRTPTAQLSQYFNATTAGPSTPAAEKTVNNPIQGHGESERGRPILNHISNTTRHHRNNPKIVSWNINGVTGKREYLRLLVEKHEPDILFLCETKRRLVINQFSELACDDTYRVVQIRSTATYRGGLIAIIRTDLQLVTAEVMRIHNSDNFAQAIILTDKNEKAYVGWYNSPMMHRDFFNNTLTRLHNDYNIQLFVGDFNARHPRWCHDHDNPRRGTQLIRFTRTFPTYTIHAPRGPTFEGVASSAKGTRRTSTVDLVVSTTEIRDLQRETGYISSCSDHYPILFTAEAQIDLCSRQRRIAKTLLQSRTLQQTIGLVYEVSLNAPIENLAAIRNGDNDCSQPTLIHEVYQQTNNAIREPWTTQKKKRRRRCSAHVTRELLRLWKRRKVLYDRSKWRPTDRNKQEYKHACAKAQRRERQLIREHERRNCQRIQHNPDTDIAKALQDSMQRRNRQRTLDRATGKQLKPKEFALYLNDNMNTGDPIDIVPKHFTVDVEQHTENVILAIKSMANNKAVGTDGLHVEMLKCNAGKAAQLLTEMWETIGRTKVVPADWLRGIVVPLFKGKGEQANPRNSLPLTILSHIRKITEKAVVIELEKAITTDKSQFGFQAGLQVLQAALSVLAALKTTARFIAVLDLAKAYDSIVKALLLAKLESKVHTNLANQLLIFLLTVHAQVAGDITSTEIAMRKGLTQGGTSSPSLFKMYINDLPRELREALIHNNKDTTDLDPIRLVADDVVCLVKDPESLQIALDTCHSWALKNKLSWNPRKSQVLDVHPDAPRATVNLGGTELQWVDQVEYLGLRLDRTGFLGKDPAVVEEKGRGALHMLTNSLWFDLNLEPKYISKEYMTHVRSTLLYGAELLTKEARTPFILIDDKLINLLISKLLKLGRTKLARKHQQRVQIALGITSFEMDVDRLIDNRIKSWIEKRTSTSKQIADRASDSLRDITTLDTHHPLRQALKEYSPTTVSKQAQEQQKWTRLIEESRGAEPNPVDRQLRASITTDRPQLNSLIEEQDIHGELRKAAVRWSIYRFPVKYTPSDEQNTLLEMMPKWQQLHETQKAKVKDNLFRVYNEEEREWGRSPLTTSGKPDIRSRTN